MASVSAGTALPVPDKPRLRGVSHQWAFLLALPLGVILVLAADTTLARGATAVFAASVAVMFGVSALYHRPTWSPGRRSWLRRLDHAAIYLLIAGTYTPFGLLVLSGAWRASVLAVVWTGALVAIVLKIAWPASPKWMAAGIALGLGWVAAVAFRELLRGAGTTATMLVLAGGLCYTLGAIVYVLRRPDPIPNVFGYHEVFHALVIAAVALQYASVAIVVTD
jgi:hemolysin III